MPIIVDVTIFSLHMYCEQFCIYYLRRVVCSNNLRQSKFYLTPDDDPSDTITLTCGKPTIEIPSRSYSIVVGEQILVPSTHLGTGGSYILGIAENNNFSPIGGLYTVREPNSVSMFWLFPQYLVMSMAEVLLEIPLTGKLNYNYFGY